MQHKQKHPYHKTNMPAWIKWKHYYRVCKWTNTSTHFPRRKFSLNNAAFSIWHNVWQTHGFVAWKMAFQRVIINNSLMTNSSDIYTSLGVCLTMTMETNTGRDRFSLHCALIKLGRVSLNKVSNISSKTLMEEAKLPVMTFLEIIIWPQIELHWMAVALRTMKKSEI